MNNMPFEKIMETENINEALNYLKIRQSTIRCVEIIEMLQRVIRGENNE